MSEIITAMYDSKSEADAAAHKLIESGISESSIQVMPGNATGEPNGDATAYDHTRDEGGFWATLKSLFMPDEDRYSYAEGMNRGSTVLSASVQDDEIETTIGILEEYGAVDVQKREAEWKAGGWNGYGDAAMPVTEAAPLPTASGMVTPEPTDPFIETEEDNREAARRIEERGTGRVRSYTVSQPTRYDDQAATYDDGLGEEHVGIQGDDRPISRTVTNNANGLFGERMIEATELPEAPIGPDETSAAGEALRPKVAGTIDDDRGPGSTASQRGVPLDAKRGL